MPKTYKNLYSRICSYRNLYDACMKAKKGKTYGDDVLRFSYNLEENLFELKEELEIQTYQPKEYTEFYINDPKRRLIRAAPFRDRVVHHALCNIIEPLFDKTFIYDSYACRTGKGTHAGVNQLQKYIQRLSAGGGGERVYALKCDVTKYFPSINHATLTNIISKKIRDEKTMNLIKLIINSSADKTIPERAGIPIGNLTSQLFANIYLNELDYYVKHALRIKYYVRYVDDFIILDKSKRRLHETKQKITEHLITQKLELHPRKATIFPIDAGVDFLGYVVHSTHKRLRKVNLKLFRKKLKKLEATYKEGRTREAYMSLNSWFAHAKQADTHNLRNKIIRENPFILDVYDEVKYAGAV